MYYFYLFFDLILYEKAAFWLDMDSAGKALV